MLKKRGYCNPIDGFSPDEAGLNTRLANSTTSCTSSGRALLVVINGVHLAKREPTRLLTGTDTACSDNRRVAGM
ncbi:MAG: hypothetical protein ACOYET_10705, partial [Bacillota bacterium]